MKYPRRVKGREKYKLMMAQVVQVGVPAGKSLLPVGKIS